MYLVDRDAVIITPKKPFLDWVNYYLIDKKEEVPKILENDKSRIYLIPEFELKKDALAFVKKNFDFFFKEELKNWIEDESVFPQKITWELFEEWLSYSIQSMVIDVAHQDIEKEEYHT